MSFNQSMVSAGVLARPFTLSTILAALTLVLLWPGLSGIFLFDDYRNILSNQTLRMETLTFDALSRAAWSYDSTGFGRPLAMLTFAADHWLWGRDPWGYKLSNLLLHVGNALLVFTLLRRTLPLERSARDWTPLAAFSLAALWALHPLQPSSVFYVVQRMEMLSVTFLLFGLILYVQARRRQILGQPGALMLIGSGAVAGIGLLSKEVAVLFPVFTLGLELTVLGFRAHSPTVAQNLRRTYALGCAVALFAFVILVFPRYANENAYLLREFTWDERLLTQLRVVPMYLGWILVPRPAQFIFYYDSFQASQGLMQPISTLFGGVFLAVLSSAALFLRSRLPLFSLGIFWFLGSHLISSNIVPLELVFEHRNYFAILGVLIAGAGLAFKLPIQPRAFATVAGILLLGASALTLLRASVWGDPLHHLTEMRDRNPTSMRASSDLAELYVKLAGYRSDSEYFALGMEEFRRAAALPGHSLLPEQGLILMSGAAGQPIDDAWWQRLIEKLNETPAISPQDITVVTGFLDAANLGIPMNPQRLAQAYAILVNRVGVPAWQVFVFGDHALRVAEDKDLALALFTEAIRRAPQRGEFARDVVKGLREAKEGEMALRVLERAIGDGLVSRAEVEEPQQLPRQ